MKSKYRKLLVGTMSAVIALTTFSACNDKFFELQDRNGMDAGIWNNEGAIQYHLNDTYDVTMPDWPYEISARNVLYASDENFGSGSDGTSRKALRLQGELAVNDVQYIASKYQGTKGDNKYFDIARCNNAIKYIPAGTLSPDTKRRFLGQYYALRAMSYFEITRLYGGVPIVLEPQNPNELTLQPRAKAAECFKVILNDLDSAIVNLNGVTWSDATERGKWTKTAAMAYKARVLLYWASPLFNPVGDGAHPNDPSRWQDALKANKEAYEQCLADGKALMPNYGEIFSKEGNANTEAIVVRSYSNKLAKRGQSVEAKSRPRSEGGGPSDFYVASQQLIDAYTMADGTPIQNAGTAYDDTRFWLNRDPRFAATIVTNGAAWALSGKTNRRQWNYVNEITDGSNAKMLYCRRFSDATLASGSVPVVEDFGGNGFDWIELRFAEVMLNYAECLNETGNTALAKDLVKQIRVRAGIQAGTRNYGLDYAVSQAQMRDLIMNERMVEFAFEGKRGYDLRRTRRLHTLVGTITTLQYTAKTAAIKTSLETADPTTGALRRDTLNLDRKGTVSAFFTRGSVFTSGNGAFAVPEYYYFYPLPNTFMNSSPLLEQTVGWDIGTFDPL